MRLLTSSRWGSRLHAHNSVYPVWKMAWCSCESCSSLRALAYWVFSSCHALEVGPVFVCWNWDCLNSKDEVNCDPLLVFLPGSVSTRQRVCVSLATRWRTLVVCAAVPLWCARVILHGVYSVLVACTQLWDSGVAWTCASASDMPSRWCLARTLNTTVSLFVCYVLGVIVTNDWCF